MLIFLQRLIRDCPCGWCHPCQHPHCHRSRRVVLYNFPLSVTWRAALTISRSTSIFLPRLIRDYPCRRHHPHRHPHRHRTRRVVSYCTISHCHWESCANNLTKQVDLFATSYSRLSLPPASSSPPSSSTSYSSRPTDAIHAAGILIDIVLVASYRTTFSCVCPSESCANNLRKFVDLLAASYSRLS